VPASAILFALIAAVLRGVGQTLQKQGATKAIGGMGLREVSRGLSPWRRLRRSMPWIVGLGLTLASMPFAIQALATGDITMVVPIFSLSMAISALLGFLVLREDVAPTEWMATGFMFVGAAFVASDPSGEGRAPVDRMDSVILGLPALAAVILVVGTRRLADIRVPAEIGYAAACGFLGGTCDSLIKLTTALVRERAGTFHVADPTTLIQLAFEPISALVIVFFAGTFLTEQLAFANGRVSVVLPVRSAASQLIVVLLGGLVFQEHLGSYRLIGVAMVILGTTLLAARQRKLQSVVGDPLRSSGRT